MSAGVIKLTNKSKAVVGTGTTFLTDLSPNDFIVSKVGGVTYTLSVVAVTSNTELVLGNAYDGPDVVAAAWNALPQETAIAIPAQVGVDAAFAMRAIVAEKTNWYKLLTLDGDVTIDLPNNTQFTGPSWRKIIKLAADADLGAFTQLAEQVVSNTAQVAANTLTVTNSMTEVEKDRSEVAANKTIILDSASQVAANKAIAETKAAEAALSAAEAAQYDSTKAVTLHGEIPAADNINSYLPNITYRGVWYKSTTGATTANGYPVNSFVGIIEVLDVNGQGIQRATHKNGSIYVRGYSSPSYSTWIPVAMGGVNNTITNLTALSGALRLGGDATNDYDAVTLKQLLAAVGGAGGPNLTGVMTNFLGAVEWFNGSRASLPSGHAPGDGQILNRVDYPDLWNAISTGMLVSVSDSVWLADANNRAKYSTGNGSTTFRMPDLNGAQTGSVKALFLRGDQGISGGVGATGSSSAPNITGAIQTVVPGQFFLPVGSSSGALSPIDAPSNTMSGVPGFNTSTISSGIKIDASKSSSVYTPGATEIRPNFATGIWIIRVNGKFSASSTLFDVITSSPTLPATGTVVWGGDVRSSYMVDGAARAVARMRATETIGSGKQVDIRVEGGTGALQVAEDGSISVGGLNVSKDSQFNGKSMAGVNVLSFISKAAAGQSAQNMGFVGTPNRVVIPISTTQAVLIQSGSSVINLNSAGENTFTYPIGYISLGSFVAVNGDANVTGSDGVNTIDFWGATPSVVNIRIRKMTQGGNLIVVSGAFRINWMVTGIISL